MNRKNYSDAKKEGVIRASFPHGSDEWDFAYITVFYIQQFYVLKSMLKSSKEQLDTLEQYGAMRLIKDAEIARLGLSDFTVDPVQFLLFVHGADQLSNFMVQSEGPEFTEAFLARLRERHTRFSTGKELETFYLPFATGYIKLLNDHYGRSELGKTMLAKTWKGKKH